MATTTDTKHANTADSVNEATRATMEASRRTVQSTQEAMRVSRDLFEQSAGAGRKLFAAYTAGVTAGIKATFEMQNAALSTGLALFETSATSDREMLQQMFEAVRQSEQAVLEAWQASIQAADKMAARNEPA